jgi:hypothetical protein
MTGGDEAMQARAIVVERQVDPGVQVEPLSERDKRL